MKPARTIRWIAAALLASALLVAPAAAQKVLRYAFPIAETGFDPAQLSDLYSITLVDHIFDPPIIYDYLARPVQLRPNTTDGMPEISADGKTITVTIRPGIYFADDPLFQGKKRELTAEDYVYSLKRHFDPRWRSPNLSNFEGYLVGMDALREQAIKSGRFDYDKPVDGIRKLDRYRFQLKLTKPNFTMIYNLADCRSSCALAREVVEHYGDRIAEHPVGTGPFRLASWRRSSKIALERNPGYREDIFDSVPPAGDALAQTVAQELKGKRLPLVDRVEISIIEEIQPRWLAFLNGEHDLIELVPAEFANVAFPNNELAPYLAKRGIRMQQYLRADITYTFFNWEDPVVGGAAPEKVALRRAIALAYRTEDEIRILRKNQAIYAQAPIIPESNGYDPALRTEMSEYNPAKARALLDLYGYLDRDGDGYRELPDGQPLVLQKASTPTQADQQTDELWRKSMSAIGVRMVFKKAKWPEHLKAARAGKLQMWGLGGSASMPDADNTLIRYYGPNTGSANLWRFQLPAFDRLYERMVSLPNGPERNAVIHEMVRLLVAYMPVKNHVHRIGTDLVYPNVHGWKNHPTSLRKWLYVDVVPDTR
jgi:ABC-type transport system substrate-binding protein